MSGHQTRLLILGAAGRDFHNFNTLYRDNTEVKVVGFTATQVPSIEGRRYPPELSGKLYPEGLEIWPEDELEDLIKKHNVERCQLAYSDLHHHAVGLIAARCLSSAADFEIPHPFSSMIKSSKPVIAVSAVRTGCGKSQVSRYIIKVLRERGLKPVLVRHPMPYGDLAKQAVQRFVEYGDLDKHQVTIEEREEYEQHIRQGTTVFAGVDYQEILRQAEKEADVVIWDGGNNDTPFYKPDLWICVTDPHRVGHETKYYPGDVNFRSADVIVINKANTAEQSAIAELKSASGDINPAACVVVTNSEVVVDEPQLVEGKRVLCIEDGPTLTHGGMEYGAGRVAADKYGAAEMADPREHLQGSIDYTFKKYPHLGKLVPAMGYNKEQVEDLQSTINAVPTDSVIIATPMDLRKLIDINKPSTRVHYGVEDRGEQPYLKDIIQKFVRGIKDADTLFEAAKTTPDSGAPQGSDADDPQKMTRGAVCV